MNSWMKMMTRKLLSVFNSKIKLQKMKMKSMKVTKFTVGLFALLALASCSNDETETENANTVLKDGIELTYNVGEAANDSAFTRAAAAQPAVETQTFMGMEVQTQVTDESRRQGTRATVYNTVDLNGKKVYAYVFDPATNKTIAPVQTVTIADNKLTVKGKVGCQVLFYIGTAPYAAEGTDISTITVNERSTVDAMQCVSEPITGKNAPLGMLSFKHLFTRMRVVLKTSDGTVVNAFSLSTADKLSNPNAAVKIADRSYTVSGDAVALKFAVANNTSATAETAYQSLIVDPAQPEKSLSLVFDMAGKGATIGGAQNYLTEVNNKLTLKTRQLLPGHRYSINITVKPSNTEQYLNSGFRADKNFYQWDAYEPYGVGDAHTWSAGNSGIHTVPTGGTNMDIATQSCKNCPSATEAKMYIGAGALIDDGHTGAYQQSYTTTNPATGAKITYHGGVWLKKKQYIPGFDNGTAPQATQSSAKGRPTADNIDQYFFLPLYGFYDNTNGLSQLYKNYGEIGYFMLKTANSTGYAYYLSANAATVTFGTRLNWTSNNIASTNIWSAD